MSRDASAISPFGEPPERCSRCPRLFAFLERHRVERPEWWNAPVPAFGPTDARLVIVGLAPGLRGANRTGRPFTGDHAGQVLYAAIAAHGFSRGRFEARADDGLELIDCKIVNAVRCVPPQNKPTGAEIANCRPFLTPHLEGARAILALGKIAFDSAARALGLRAKDAAFGHGVECVAPGGRTLLGSYHCSRYNMNTRRLTEQMFARVFARAAERARA